MPILSNHMDVFVILDRQYRYLNCLSECPVEHSSKLWWYILYEVNNVLCMYIMLLGMHGSILSMHGSILSMHGSLLSMRGSILRRYSSIIVHIAVSKIRKFLCVSMCSRFPLCHGCISGELKAVVYRAG